MAIDWAVWDMFDELSVFQAACLWAGYDPNTVRVIAPPQEVQNVMSNIFKNFEGGRLQKGEPFMRHQQMICRSSLKEWAANKGQYPAFLFPEQRNGKVAKPKSKTELDVRERKTELMVMLALLRQCDIEPKEPRQTGKLKVILENTLQDPIKDTDTLKKVLDRVAEFANDEDL